MCVGMHVYSIYVAGGVCFVSKRGEGADGGWMHAPGVASSVRRAVGVPRVLVHRLNTQGRGDNPGSRSRGRLVFAGYVGTMSCILRCWSGVTQPTTERGRRVVRRVSHARGDVGVL